MKYEAMKQDMVAALKSGDKLRRVTLADMVAAIEKAAIAGKVRVEITDALVNETLTKYRKTIQEQIDTCPNTDKYVDRKAEYVAKLAIVLEYAPNIISDPYEVETMILNFACDNNITLVASNRGQIMKTIMPFLKQNNCDMKVANSVLNGVIA